jgi:hypothetical protein
MGEKKKGSHNDKPTNCEPCEGYAGRLHMMQ